MSRYGSDDCMLYYNSKCYKGNSCQFRHEPSALTMDTTCKFWMRGNCTRFPCIFRHAWMPRKDRSHQKCHLESLKGRCSRPYCPFRHDTVEPPRISGPSAVPPVAPYKGRLISKADWRAIDSPKKRTDGFILFAFLLFTANKSNSSVRFSGESTARQSAFWFYLTFSTADSAHRTGLIIEW